MRLRIALAALVIAALVLIAGCEPKVYFFSFKVEQDLENTGGNGPSKTTMPTSTRTA